MTSFTPQSVLAALALLALGVLGGMMLFMPVPQANTTLLATIVGALAGALTVAGGSKVADKITNAGSSTTVQNPPST